ncbi:hypothetical protein D8I24_6507 [Cupriavidus necator H850]|nr:hypothetical protein D8I24_6507 [Cupriavidus necator H850]
MVSVKTDNDINQHEALYSLASRYPGSIEGLAQAMGRRLGRQMYPNVLRNKLRPGIDTHHLNFEEYSLILELCEEAKLDGWRIPMHALCWRHGMVAIPLPQGEGAPASVANAMRQAGEAAREFGEMMGEFAQAAADGKITRSEAERVLPEIQHVLTMVTMLRESVEAVTVPDNTSPANPRLV